MAGRRLRSPPAQTFVRFWTKVKMGPMYRCWPYTGALDQDGYGVFYDGKAIKAHRYAFRCANGRDAEPMALHRCNNRACCNPTHLYEGTALDNVTDCISAGNYVTVYVAGERHPNAKLTSAQVREALSLMATGHKQNAVAQRFGVTAGALIYHRKRNT